MRKITFKLGKRSEKDNKLKFIVIYLYAVMFTDIVRLLAALLDSQALESAVEPFRNVVYFLILAGYMLYAPNKTRIMYGTVVVAFFGVLGASLLINPALEQHAMTLSLMFISRFLLGFVMIANLEKPLELCREIAKLAWILPLYVVLYWNTPHDLSTGSAYSMTFSYNLMLPAAACMIRAKLLQEKKVISWIWVAVAITGILFFGSRGTLLCIMMVAVLLVILSEKKYTLGRFIWQILGLVVVVVIIAFGKDIIEYLIKLVPESRTLRLLRDSEFFWESNRDSYSDMAKSALKESPFSIYGLAGDAYVYAGKSISRMELGRHSHNVFTELLVSYGVVVGGPICIWLGYKIVKAFKKIKENPEKRVLCIMFVAVLLPYVLLSGSTCQSHYHWLLLGAVVNKVVGHNKEQNNRLQ